MSPLKSAFAGLAVGLIAYFVVGNIGAIFPSQGDSALALIGTEVSPSLSPGDNEVTSRVTKSVTKSAPGDNPVSPSLSPSVTNLAPSPLVAVTPRVSSLVTPTASPTASVLPRLSVTPSPTPTQSPTPTPTPLVTPTPTPPVGTAHIVINEIAWAGTATSSADEWVELYNWGSAIQDLNGWVLCDAGGPIITFSALHQIGIGQYFLIERGDDDQTISDIQADFAHAFSSGGLSNSGENLKLRSGSCTDGAVIDEVGPGAWYFGSASPFYSSMERIFGSVSGTEPSNWATNDGTVTTGLDAEGNLINGTPKFRNSVSP